MIRKAYIRNQARKESYLRERRESKKWSELPKYRWTFIGDMLLEDYEVRDITGKIIKPFKVN